VLTIILVSCLVFATWIAIDGLFRHRNLCRLLRAERERRRGVEVSRDTWRQTAIEASAGQNAMTEQALQAWQRVHQCSADAIRYRRACEWSVREALNVLELYEPQRARELRAHLDAAQGAAPGQRTH
jgi:hypothetical protein